jgi:hypothetical protein
VFSWAAARFGTIFFAFWPSLVPADRFEHCWQFHGLVTEQGRVLFLEEHPEVRDKEAYAAGTAEIVERRLADRLRAPPGQCGHSPRPTASPAAPARLAEPHPPGLQ